MQHRDPPFPTTGQGKIPHDLRRAACRLMLEGKPAEEIAKTFGRTPKQIRQLKQTALYGALWQQLQDKNRPCKRDR